MRHNLRNFKIILVKIQKLHILNNKKKNVKYKYLAQIWMIWFMKKLEKEKITKPKLIVNHADDFRYFYLILSLKI